MIQGTLIKESLESGEIGKLIKVTGTETWLSENSADYQPDTWTAVFFSVEDDKLDAVTACFSRTLKRRWYADITTDDKKYIVFRDKIFSYDRKIASGRKAAADYARSIGIPQSQIDWQD